MTDIIHVTFSTIDVLPPLLHEIDSLASTEFRSRILGLRYDATKLSREMRGSKTIIHRLTLITRRISTRQIFILKFIRYIEFSSRVIWFLMRHRSRILVAHDMSALIPCFLYSRLKRITLMYNAHELWSEVNDSSTPLLSLWRVIEQNLVRRIDVVVTPNTERSRIFHEELLTKKKPITVLNASRVHSFEGLENIIEKKIGLRKSDGFRFILYQGLFESNRCLHELIHAMASLDESNILVLLGRGDSSFIEGMKNCIRSNRVERQVFLLDPVPYEQLMAYTASADVGVLLYRNSGRNNYFCAPNKLYEYLHRGLPVLASNFPDLYREVEGNVFGVCVNPSDPFAIARGIKEIYLLEKNEPALHERIQHSSEKAFNWQNEFSQLHSLYDGLLGEINQ